MEEIYFYPFKYIVYRSWWLGADRRRERKTLNLPSQLINKTDFYIHNTYACARTCSYKLILINTHHSQVIWKSWKPIWHKRKQTCSFWGSLQDQNPEAELLICLQPWVQYRFSNSKRQILEIKICLEFGLE